MYKLVARLSGGVRSGSYCAFSSLMILFLVFAPASLIPHENRAFMAVLLHHLMHVV